MTTRGRLASVLVVSRSDLTDLPIMPTDPAVTIRTMDLDDPVEIDRWLEVHNDAFGHHWTTEDFQRSMLRNPVLEVMATFAIEEGPVCLAVGSAARFRRNEGVGAGHWIAVRSRARRRGLGRLLAIHRYSWLRDRDFKAAESQTNLARESSLRMHWDCGFVPKYRLDHWNSGSDVDRFTRALAHRRLRRLYDDWTRHRS